MINEQQMKNKVLNWMRKQIRSDPTNYFDECGEPEYTKLAVEAANHFDPSDKWLDDETHFVWDLSIKAFDLEPIESHGDMR